MTIQSDTPLKLDISSQEHLLLLSLSSFQKVFVWKWKSWITFCCSDSSRSRVILMWILIRLLIHRDDKIKPLWYLLIINTLLLLCLVFYVMMCHSEALAVRTHTNINMDFLSFLHICFSKGHILIEKILSEQNLLQKMKDIFSQGNKKKKTI